ncbi:MAG: tetratricopeptide repeat protein [Myxococcales bacterium]|nr:tetratricopeptide repeat protein [Myxococcales bacterium]
MALAMWKSVTRGMFLAAVMTGAMGCPRTATFTVTRPAMLNASAVGNTMSMGPIAVPRGAPQDMQAAAEITADLQNRISHSLNAQIRLLAAGGGVVITGAILGNDYGERQEVVDRTCTRSVPVGNGQFRAENYACRDLRRIGVASAQIQFQITHGQSGEVLFNQTYQDSRTVTTVGIRSAYENRDPAFIDGGALLHNVRTDLVEHFAHVILPWQENVTVVFEDCDGENRCREGYNLVQAGNLAAAEPLFTQVIGEYAAPGSTVPPNLAERVGEAFYNRGITRSYLGRYSLAVADLTRAIALRPDESEWNAQLENARQMARDQESLRQQGAAQNETQNVQQAGTP